MKLFRRFWTRNRPGDIDNGAEKNEESLPTHGVRHESYHRDESALDHRSEEFNMPGFGFEGGLLEQLQQQGSALNVCSIVFYCFEFILRR